MTKRTRRTLAERLWTRLVRSPSGCWEWTGSGSDGYGLVRVDGRTVPAHKAVYELLVEPVPEGLQLDHLCRNRRCCNPAHLEPVTPLENTRRGMGHGSETHCPSGHPYSGENLAVSGGRRKCRTCKRVAERERRARRSSRGRPLPLP